MKIYQFIFSVILAQLLAAPVCAEVLVTDAYVRGLPPGVSTTSAYMTLQNTGELDMELSGALSPVAGSLMLHTTTSHDGMLHMEHVAKALIPAHGELKLQSGGMHLMLMDLKHQPVPGDSVELTLQFADGTTKTVTLEVRSVLDE